MSEAIVFLAEDFEEIEALAVIDVLRRGDVDTASVSLTADYWVRGAHGITVKADRLFTELPEPSSETASSLLVLPGGPGTENYKKHNALLKRLTAHHQAGGCIGAICAAPTVLGMLGLLEGKTAVCYPSMEPALRGARIGTHAVESDKGIITAKGPATAIAFALVLLKTCKGEAKADEVRRHMLYGTTH